MSGDYKLGYLANIIVSIPSVKRNNLKVTSTLFVVSKAKIGSTQDVFCKEGMKRKDPINSQNFLIECALFKIPMWKLSTKSKVSSNQEKIAAILCM